MGYSSIYEAPLSEYYVRLCLGFQKLRRKYGLEIDFDDYRRCGNHPDTDWRGRSNFLPGVAAACLALSLRIHLGSTARNIRSELSSRIPCGYGVKSYTGTFKFSLYTTWLFLKRSHILVP
jgi:hypothetical protein